MKKERLPFPNEMTFLVLRMALKILHHFVGNFRMAPTQLLNCVVANTANYPLQFRITQAVKLVCSSVGWAKLARETTINDM